MAGYRLLIKPSAGKEIEALDQKKDRQRIVAAIRSLADDPRPPGCEKLAIPVPTPPEGSFDKSSADRGRAVFNGKSKCAVCHVPPIFTEPGWNLHKPEEIGIDAFQADRAPDRAYRTSPLRALWDSKKIHKGGFYHDGRFATLQDVVDHYNAFMKLGLTTAETRDLIEYLKSL